MKQHKSYFLGLEVIFTHNKWVCTSLWWCAIGTTQKECLDNAEHILQYGN